MCGSCFQFVNTTRSKSMPVSSELRRGPRRHRERLVDVGHDVFDVLDADREPDQLGADAAGDLLLL